jgi:hypothetical protein
VSEETKRKNTTQMTHAAPLLLDVFPPELDNNDGRVLRFDETEDITVAGVTLHDDGRALWVKSSKDGRLVVSNARFNKPVCYRAKWHDENRRMAIWPTDTYFVEEQVCCVCSVWKDDCNDEGECADCSSLLDEVTPLDFLNKLEDYLYEREMPGRAIINRAKRAVIGENKASFYSNQNYLDLLYGVDDRAA